MALAVGVGLGGCEAELRLDGITNTLEQPIRRTDQFLALSQDADGGLFAFADHGVVITGTRSSPDDGIQWSRTEIPEPAPSFIDSTTCTDGSVYALSFENALWSWSADGWQSSPTNSEEQLQAITCNATGHLWVTGAFGTLLNSTDRGATWETFSFYDDFTLTAISFADANTGYAVGEFGTLAKTSDGGESWELLDPIADDFYPLAVHFNSADEGWVSGVLGLILHTDDGGATWTTQATDTVASIYGFLGAGDDTYAYGDLGALLRYDRSQQRWVDQPSPDIPVHYASAASLDGQLLLVGGWGVVLTVPVDDENNKEAL